MKILSGIRVSMVTSSHPAYDDRIFFKEARSLVKAGAEVTVLCAENMVPPQETFGVRFSNYEGGGTLKRRALSIRRLENAICAGRFDVVHAHEPDSLVAALRVKERKGIKVIFDSHEMWSGIVAQRFSRPIWPVVEAAYCRLESRWLRRCDAAFGASEAITRYLESFLSPGSVATILNVPVSEVFGEFERAEWGDETILCHDGFLTFDRGLKVMAEAVCLLIPNHHVILKIVGDVFGNERRWLDRFIIRNNIDDRIIRTGWLPYTQVGSALAPCHIGLICFQPSPNAMIAAPNKCFNYLLYGMPVVAPFFPDSHFKILADEKCARLFDPTSSASLAKTLATMMEKREQTREMASRARNLSRTKYRWEHMEPILFDMYKRVLRTRN